MYTLQVLNRHVEQRDVNRILEEDVGANATAVPIEDFRILYFRYLICWYYCFVDCDETYLCVLRVQINVIICCGGWGNGYESLILSCKFPVSTPFNNSNCIIYSPSSNHQIKFAHRRSILQCQTYTPSLSPDTPPEYPIAATSPPDPVTKSQSKTRVTTVLSGPLDEEWRCRQISRNQPRHWMTAHWTGRTATWRVIRCPTNTTWLLAQEWKLFVAK